jgi:hypothetical protein
LSQRLVTELEIAAAASQNLQAGNGITFNVNGPVGLIQTGDGSQGTVSQHIDEGLKNEITSALSLLIGLLEKPENSSIGSRDELREMVLEAKAEAEKPSSNGLKLASSLRGIVEITKFVGACLHGAETRAQPSGYLFTTGPVQGRYGRQPLARGVFERRRGLFRARSGYLGPFGEVRIPISKPSWRARDREKTGTPAIDP